MTNTTADVLSAAADLLERPGAWTQGSFARTKGGSAIGANTPGAVCWCMDGALVHVAKSMGSTQYLTARNFLISRFGDVPAIFNDAPDRTQAEVVAAFRAAALEAKEG